MMKQLTDALGAVLDPQATVLLMILAVAGWRFARMISGDNPIEAWHFYASPDRAGKQWGDPKKLAVMVFIFASTVFVGYTFWAHPVDNFWVVAVFFGWAIAMLGIDVFAAWARSFVDRRFGQPAPGLPKPPAGPPEAKGFVQLQLIGILAGVVAFLGYSAWIYHEGGRGPRAELERFRSEVAAAQKIHEAEDAKKAAQTRTIIEEKDHERETVLANSGRAWADELARVRGERDRLARAGSKPARIVARVCDGADGNQRLSDALGKAERDTRAAIADYQAGTGELLVIAERQAANWDNLKSAVAGIRALNTAPVGPPR